MSTIAISTTSKRRRREGSVAYNPGGPERQYVSPGSGYRRTVRRGRRFKKVNIRRLSPLLVGHCTNEQLFCNEIDKGNGKIVIGSCLHTAVGGTGAEAQIHNLPCHLWQLNQLPGFTSYPDAYRLAYRGAGNTTNPRQYYWEPSLYMYTSSDGGDGTVEVAGSLDYTIAAAVPSPSWRSATETEAELKARRFHLYRGSTVDLILYGQKSYAVHYRIDLIRFKFDGIDPHETSRTTIPIADDAEKLNGLGEALISKYCRNPLLDVENPARFMDIIKTWTFDLPEGQNENSTTNGIDHLPSLRTSIKIPMNRKYTCFKSYTNAYDGQSYAYKFNPEDPAKLSVARQAPEVTGSLQYKRGNQLDGELYPKEHLWLMIRATDPKLHVATDYTLANGIVPTYDIKIRNKWACVSSGLTAI